MAVWFLDNVSGSPSNNGLSVSTPKKDMVDIKSLVTSLDIIKLKDTGVPYDLPVPSSLNETFFTNLPNILMITRWDTDTANPRIRQVKHASSNFSTNLCGSSGSNSRYTMLKCDLELDYLDNTNSACPMVFSSGSNLDVKFVNSEVFLKKTGVNNATSPSLFEVSPSSSSSFATNFINSKIHGDKKLFNIDWGTYQSGIFTNSFLNGVTLFATGALFSGLLITKSRLYFGLYSTSNMWAMSYGSSITMFGNNNVLVYDSGYYSSGRRFYNVFNNASNFGHSFNNIIVSEDSGLYYAGASSPFTKEDAFYYPVGNNVYYGFADYTNNLTNFKEDMGTSYALSSSPYLSHNPASPDFMKLDYSSSEVQDYILNKSLLDPYENIGADAYSLGGETDPSKVLNTSIVVSGLINPAKLLEDDLSGNGTLEKSKVLTTGGGDYVSPIASDVKKDIDFGFNETGTYDPITGQWEAFTPSEVVVGASKKQNGITVTGTQAVPAPSNVRSGVATGTSTGTVIVPVASDVRDGVDVDNTEGSLKVPSASDVREGVDVDNTVGTLDVEFEANLPDTSDVKTGSGNYGPNLDKVPSYTPDFPERENVAPDDTVDGQAGTMDLPLLSSVDPLDTLRGNQGTMDVPALDRVSPNATLRNVQGTQDLPSVDNVLETDSVEGVQGQVPMNKLAPSEGGSYLGEESNSQILPEDYRNGKPYTSLGENLVGSLTGGDIDPKYILYPFGTLGEINDSNVDVSKQLTDNARLFIANLLGQDWAELKYFKEPEKNDLYSNTKQWGIRPTWDEITHEKIGKDTLDLEFEIKLTTDFTNQDGDEAERQAELFLIEKMEAIRRQLRSTKFYKASIVRIVREWDRPECEKIGTNVVLCEATVVVNIDVRNT